MIPAFEPVLAMPLVAAALLAVMANPKVAARVNVVASVCVLVFALRLLWFRPLPGLLFVDDLSATFLVLGGFVGAIISLFGAGSIGRDLATGGMTVPQSRACHAMFQLVLFAMNLALMANNIGLLWIAVELATLIAVLATGIYRTPAAIAAMRGYLLPGGVGMALALAGTVLVCLVGNAMAWTTLIDVAPGGDPVLLGIAFACLLFGYGAKIGLVPLQVWLPDAQAEAPTPIAAVISALLPGVALYALLRFKMLLVADPAAMLPGPPMIGLGLATLAVAAVMLYRQRDIKRLLACSSMAHMGVAVFAFGIGGPLGNFAGLLQVVVHSLAKSVAVFAAGPAIQVKRSLRGWATVAGVAAIAGLPPFGIFRSEFLPPALAAWFEHLARMLG